MAKKLSPQTIKALGALILAGVTVAQEVWKHIDENERLSEAVRAFGTKMAKTAKIRKPIDRLEAQLTLMEEQARKAMTEQREAGGSGQANTEQAQAWLARASVLRAKLPLLKAQTGKDRRKNLKELQAQTAALLQDMVAFGLDADQR